MSVSLSVGLAAPDFVGCSGSGSCRVLTIVADPGCLSRIPDPEFYPSRIPDPWSGIPDPKTATKESGEKIFFCHTFLCSHKFHKIVNYFSFEVLKKKIWANFKRIVELFTQKIVTKLLKIWVWDPGVKKAPDPGSRIRIRNTGLTYLRVTCRVVSRTPAPCRGVVDTSQGDVGRHRVVVAGIHLTTFPVCLLNILCWSPTTCWLAQFACMLHWASAL